MPLTQKKPIKPPFPLLPYETNIRSNKHEQKRAKIHFISPSYQQIVYANTLFSLPSREHIRKNISEQNWKLSPFPVFQQILAVRISAAKKTINTH